MKRTPVFEDSWKQCNEEAKMAKIQLKNIQANVEQLLSKIESCDELDAWVQSYLTKADDYLDSVKKYVVFGQDDEETIIEPTLVGDEPEEFEEPDMEEPEMDEPKDSMVPEPMPPLDQFDPEADSAPGMNLMGAPDGEVEEPVEDEIEEPIGDEVVIEDPEEEIDDVEVEDTGDDDLMMPPIGDFEVADGEAIPASDISMPPKKEETDELNFDDIDFFNSSEFVDSDEEEQMAGDFDDMENPDEIEDMEDMEDEGIMASWGKRPRRK
jgi:hypothetical protein